MIKILTEALEKLIYEKWGLSKTCNVIGISVTFGTIGAILGASVIPDKPELLEEKENDENE